MKAKIIKTEGYALGMKLEIEDSIYHVMDVVSSPGSKAQEGETVDIELDVFIANQLYWDDMFSGNLEKMKKLEHIDGWSYYAYGQIKQINPVIVDCGIIQIKNVIHTNDIRCINEFVKLKITRLDAFLDNKSK
ncbi:hypothetical protein JW948_14705 [bacterium]|nr:hypothetical protein [bacterium]